MSEFKRIRTNRRKFVGGIAAGAAATAVTGSASQASAAPAFLRQGGTTEIEVWGGVPAENGPGNLVDAFHEAHPSIKVNYVQYKNDPTGNTQLDTALQGGTPIDVFFTYGLPRLTQRVGAGLALNMGPYIDADSGISQWAAETPGVFRYEGEVYGLPAAQEPQFAFINKNKLEAAGISLPEAGWTTEEYMELAQTLSTDGAFGTYEPPNSARQTLGPDYWYKNDGTESNFDDPAFRESLERHKSMIDAGTAFPWTDVLAQNLKGFSQQPFLTEQTIIWFTASWQFQNVGDTEQYPHDFVTTFAPLPVPTGVETPWNTGSYGIYPLINAKTENPDAAWEFVQFWLTDGAQYMLSAGKMPAYPGTDEDTIIELILGPDRDELYDVEAYRKVIFDPEIRLVNDTIITASAEIQTIYDGLTDRYLIGEISIDEWVEEMKSQADAAISEA